MNIVFRESNLLGLTTLERRELEQRGPDKYSDIRVRFSLLILKSLSWKSCHRRRNESIPLLSQADAVAVC